MTNFAFRLSHALRHCGVLAVLLAAQPLIASDDGDLDALFADDSEAGETTTARPPPSPTPSPYPRAITLAADDDEVKRRSTPRSPVLEEIIVTAQKRAQALSDVPVSVTAISGNKLLDAGIENLTDLSEYTPNFKLVDSGLIPNVYMRGVGSGSNQGFELSVGIFADGIHLGRPHQTRAAFMDVERVEVLRGPQSILFGKNAIAGALNIVSARPDEEFFAQFSSTASAALDTTEFLGVVSGPLSNNWGARAAVRKRSSDGDIFNSGQQRDEPRVDESSLRLTLDWEPSDSFDGSLKLEHNGRMQRGRTFQTTHPGALTRCTGEDVSLDRNRVSDARETASIDSYNLTLTLNQALLGGELTLVSGLSGFDSDDLFDADSSSLDTLDLLGIERYDQFSQEIRFTSPLGGAVDFIGGLFYQTGDLSFYEFGPTKARAGALSDSPLCELNLQVLAAADLERDFLINAQAWSAFGQLTWTISPQFRGTFGLRFVQEEKTGERHFRIFEPGTRDPANPVSLAALDRLLINEHDLQGQRDIGVWLPSVNLQYDLPIDSMAYLSYTKGAKSGSFDARNNNGNDDDVGGATRFEFEDETANAYELGAKSRLLDGRASLNIAVYWVDYQDMQVSVYDGVAGFTVTNAGSARTRGVELDGRWRLNESWLIGAAVAYLDFEWLDYRDGPCHANSENEDPDNGTCDLTGQQNQQTPDWTASLSATWSKRLLQRWLLDMTVDANFRDQHFTSGDLDPRGIQDAHTKWNARISLSPPSERWSLAMVGRNLTDELTLGIGAPTALDLGGYRASTEPSRQILLDAQFRF